MRPTTRPPSVLVNSRRLIFACFSIALSSSLAAQIQFAELRKQHLPSLQTQSDAVVYGDVDGDGDVDIICGNFGQDRLYLNDGRGRFVDATSPRLPANRSGTEALALGDVDGDGDLDLISVKVTIGSVLQDRLYLNDGSGNFSDATVGRMPKTYTNARAVALGDVDGDGDLDIVLAITRGRNRLYMNDGSGSFVDATAVRMPKEADASHAVAMGDLDGDGDLDIIFGNWLGQDRLILNDGKGVFTDASASGMPTAVGNSSDLSLSDVDGDGDLDLVTASAYGQNQLALNDGKAVFTDATAGRMPSLVANTTSVIAFDWDRDGDLDLLFGNMGTRNRLFRNDGTGTFVDATMGNLPSETDFTDDLAAFDAEGDGDLDLVALNDGQNRIYFEIGNGRFVDGTSGSLGAGYHQTRALAAGDIDGDGDVDLVMGNAGFGIQPGEFNQLLLRDDQGGYEDVSLTQLPGHRDLTQAVAIGDVDGDGDLDLVFGNSGFQVAAGAFNRLYTNDGTGMFLDATASGMPSLFERTNALVLGDVDGDGDLDLVIANSGQNRLLINGGKGIYLDATATGLPSLIDESHGVALGDVDNDGDLDLLIANSFEPSRLYLNDGKGKFRDVSASQIPTSLLPLRGVAFGDVDGDGDLDVVFNGLNPLALLWTNQGTGVFTDVTAIQMHVSATSQQKAYSMALGDVDLDGDLDVVLGNDGSESLLLNNGRGVFVDVSRRRLMSDHARTSAVLLADLDRDGDLDLVLGHASGRAQRLHNLQSQIDTPHKVQVGWPYQLDAYARTQVLASTDLVLPFLSSATARIPLPSLGTLGLDPRFMIALPQLWIQQPSGRGSISVSVPNNPNLVGLHFYAQAVHIGTARPLRLTNRTGDKVGN